MKFANATNTNRKSGVAEWRDLRDEEVKPQIPPLRYPGFPVGLGGVGELHAAFFTENRTRGRW